MSDKTLDISYDKIVTESERARLFDIGDTRIWIPKSVTKDVQSKYITILEWFAIEEELGEYSV